MGPGRAAVWRKGAVLAAIILAPLCCRPASSESAAPGGLAEGVFTASPLEADEIERIIPLGNLNPRGGHVFPTDHIYLNYGGKPGLEVFAPGDGTVFAIRPQLHGGDKIEVRVDRNVTYYLAHVRLQGGIRVGMRLKAGQAIGRVAGESTLDLGACDARAKISGLLDPSRYPWPTLHAVPPLELFAEPLKSRLHAKVAGGASDGIGRFDFDQAGKLVGNWFHESLPASQSARAGPEIWSRQLAFVCDNRRPGAVRVSIGGTVAPAGLYAVRSGGPDPAAVSQATGLVRYELAATGGRGSPPLREDSAPQAPLGVLCVQLTGERKLRAEYFPGKRAGDVVGFTAEASLYVR